jgi:hypothetical protein
MCIKHFEIEEHNIFPLETTTSDGGVINYPCQSYYTNCTIYYRKIEIKKAASIVEAVASRQSKHICPKQSWPSCTFESGPH